MAIKKTFGEELTKDIYVSSTKGQTGHALGAAGGLEAIVCAKAIQTVRGALAVGEKGQKRERSGRWGAEREHSLVSCRPKQLIICGSTPFPASSAVRSCVWLLCLAKSLISPPPLVCMLCACVRACVCAPLVVYAKGELPPTINYETPDPECDLRIFGEKVKVDKVKGALSSNLVRRASPLHIHILLERQKFGCGTATVCGPGRRRQVCVGVGATVPL